MGDVQMMAKPSFDMVSRNSFCSKMPSSIILCMPTTTAPTCWQCGGIHKKARGCLLVSPDTSPLTGMDHCHTAARLLSIISNISIVSAVVFLFIFRCLFLKGDVVYVFAHIHVRSEER